MAPSSRRVRFLAALSFAGVFGVACADPPQSQTNSNVASGDAGAERRGGNGEDDDLQEECDVGEFRECEGARGCQGTQSCERSSRTWSPCFCAAPDQVEPNQPEASGSAGEGATAGAPGQAGMAGAGAAPRQGGAAGAESTGGAAGSPMGVSGGSGGNAESGGAGGDSSSGGAAGMGTAGIGAAGIGAAGIGAAGIGAGGGAIGGAGGGGGAVSVAGEGGGESQGGTSGSGGAAGSAGSGTGGVGGSGSCSVQELIPANAGFDDGGGWYLLSGQPPVLVADDLAHTPPNLALFGGYEDANDEITQVVAIPAGATGITLSLWTAIDTDEGMVTAYDIFVAGLFDGIDFIEPVIALSNQTLAADWTQFQVTLPNSVAGQSFQLSLVDIGDGSFPTWFFIDTISLTANVCD